MRRMFPSAICVSLLTITITAFAGDVNNGKRRYDKHCYDCHDTRFHTRLNRKIHVYEDLVTRVEFCNTRVKAGFGKRDLIDVTDYLNDFFYKFIKE